MARYRSDLPPGTDAVLARGLAKEPQDRYGRCGEFAAALRDTLVRASHSASVGRRAGAGSGSASLAGTAQTRRESAPRAPRPPYVPQTAVWSGTAGEAPPAAAASQLTWAAQPTAGADAPTPVFPGAGATIRREDASPATAVSGPAARAATPAASPPAGGRPATPPAPPPPAAGQGGKLPLVSRSAVIATLAAAAALALLFLLHGLGGG